MWAAVNGHAETVSLLLKAGVDPSAKDGEGKTAAALAREAKRVNIEELLKTRRS